MAGHVDGYPAHAAFSLVLGASHGAPATSRKADVVVAAYQAATVAAKLLKPDMKGGEVSEAVSKVVESFGCKAIECLSSCV